MKLSLSFVPEYIENVQIQQSGEYLDFAYDPQNNSIILENISSNAPLTIQYVAGPPCSFNEDTIDEISTAAE